MTTAQHPLAATKWARPRLLHAVCRERIPFVRTQGVLAVLSAFLSLLTLTFDLLPLTLTFELGRDFCTVHLTAKFHHPMLNRLEVILWTNKLTDKQTPLKTSTSLHYATPVGNQ